MSIVFQRVIIQIIRTFAAEACHCAYALYENAFISVGNAVVARNNDVAEVIHNCVDGLHIVVAVRLKLDFICVAVGKHSCVIVSAVERGNYTAVGNRKNIVLILVVNARIIYGSGFIENVCVGQ